MKDKIEEIVSRKEFLAISGRAIVLFVLLLVPGFLISKKRVSAKPENCDLNIQCRNCDKNSNCDLIK